MSEKRANQRGIALVTVLIAIAITLVISNDFGTSTNTDMVAAANYRDEMRAHFLARSAQNMAELIFQVQAKFDGPEMRKNMTAMMGAPVQLTDFANQIVMPFCGDDEQVKAAIGTSSSDNEGLGADIGECGFNGPFETEDNKINLNCANNPAMAELIKASLASLVFFAAYDPIFEEADAEGWRRDREMQVNSIVDYIDRDSTRGVAKAGVGGGGEDYGYESLKDRYEAKNWYVDTLGEVKLARGVDDRFWSLFGKAFTAYGECKINLGAVDDPQLIAAVLSLSVHKDKQNQPTLQDPRKLFMLAAIVAKAKQYGESFNDADDFITFVKDPNAALMTIAGSGGAAGSAAGNALTQGLGLPPGEKVGLEIDKKNLESIATFKPRRTYRIEAYGEITRKQMDAQGKPVFPPIRKTVTGIWHMGTTLQKSRKAGPQAPKGAWHFLRED